MIEATPTLNLASIPIIFIDNYLLWLFISVIFLVWWIDVISSVLIVIVILIIVNIISLQLQLLLITRLSITSDFCSLTNHHIAIVLHLLPPINPNNTKSVSNFGCMRLPLRLVLCCLCREATCWYTRLLEREI